MYVSPKLFPFSSRAYYLFCSQGPDAVHIQQVGQKELKRAPGLHKRIGEVQKKEKVLLGRAGFKAHL